VQTGKTEGYSLDNINNNTKLRDLKRVISAVETTRAVTVPPVMFRKDVYMRITHVRFGGRPNVIDEDTRLSSLVLRRSSETPRYIEHIDLDIEYSEYTPVAPISMYKYRGCIT